MSATNEPAQPLRLYRAAISGHSHRAELLLSLLRLPYELIDVDLLAGAHKRAEFLQLNAFGQVPVLEDGDVVVPDSNAILVYLATRYAPASWYPANAMQRAAVQRWLSVAAGQLAHGAAAARIAVLFKSPADTSDMIKRAHALLALMERELDTRPFLAALHVTIADLANYTYTAYAPEGDVSLDAYHNVRAWLARVEALPGFVPMVKSNVGLRAADSA
ncbi:MAG: glutathione S-transferase [Steroidobacteraceae bacterium]